MLAILAVASREGVTLADEGLSVNGIRRRFIPWSAIDDIRIDDILGARNIVIARGYDRIRLRAPVTGLLQHDPEFDDKYAELRAWWSAHRGPGWRPFVPQPARAARRRQTVTTSRPLTRVRPLTSCRPWTAGPVWIPPGVGPVELASHSPQAPT